MSSLFEHTSNTRFVLKSNERYIRSDVPVHLTEEEIQWLIERKILTVIDLRTEAERRRKPCVLAECPEFRYLEMPVTGGDIVPDSTEAVAGSYVAMCDAQMQKILETILTSETGVLYFCNAGKDRTGVVTALLLKHFGVDEELIIQDYMESKANLMPMLLAYQAQNPEDDIEVITPHEEYIQGVIGGLL